MSKKIENSVCEGKVLHNSFTPPTKMVEQQGGEASSGESSGQQTTPESGSAESTQKDK